MWLETVLSGILAMLRREKEAKRVFFAVVFGPRWKNIWLAWTILSLEDSRND